METRAVSRRRKPSPTSQDVTCSRVRGSCPASFSRIRRLLRFAENDEISTANSRVSRRGDERDAIWRAPSDASASGLASCPLGSASLFVGRPTGRLHSVHRRLLPGSPGVLYLLPPKGPGRPSTTRGYARRQKFGAASSSSCFWLVARRDSYRLRLDH